MNKVKERRKMEYKVKNVKDEIEKVKDEKKKYINYVKLE
jgi:hypothetical protein